MPREVQTTQELINQALQYIETALFQETPESKVAYNKIIATILGSSQRPLQDLTIDRLKEVFITTASEIGLTVFGNELDVPRKPAVSTQMTILFPATTGTTIAKGYFFNGVENGLGYSVDVETVSVLNVATIQVTAENTGSESNLVAGQDTLKVTSPIPGQLSSTATIDTVDVTGTAQEILEDWRTRLLFAQRSVKGGNSPSDHKIQAEKIEGVRTVFPYTGQSDLSDPIPGNRFVYVEATTDVDPDGIAPQSLLDQVRESYITDPITGKQWSQLGLNDDTLEVLSITRDSVYVTVNDLQIGGGQESSWNDSAVVAYNLYFDKVRPFVTGVDFEVDRLDSITDTGVSGVADDVNESFGSSSAGVAFGLVPLAFSGRVDLNPGQLLKLGTISYV